VQIGSVESTDGSPRPRLYRASPVPRLRLPGPAFRGLAYRPSLTEIAAAWPVPSQAGGFRQTQRLLPELNGGGVWDSSAGRPMPFHGCAGGRRRRAGVTVTSSPAPPAAPQAPGHSQERGTAAVTLRVDEVCSSDGSLTRQRPPSESRSGRRPSRSTQAENGRLGGRPLRKWRCSAESLS